MWMEASLPSRRFRSSVPKRALHAASGRLSPHTRFTPSFLSILSDSTPRSALRITLSSRNRVNRDFLRRRAPPITPSASQSSTPKPPLSRTSSSQTVSPSRKTLRSPSSYFPQIFPHRPLVAEALAISQLSRTWGRSWQRPLPLRKVSRSAGLVGKITV